MAMSLLSNTSSAENTALNAAGMTSSMLSVVGSLLIIGSYLAWKDLRTTTRKLLVYLSICDLSTALFNFIGLSQSVAAKQSNTDVCIAQSFFNTWSSMSSFCWTVAIGIYLHVCLVKRNPAGAERLVLYFHLVSWFVVVVVVVVVNDDSLSPLYHLRLVPLALTAVAAAEGMLGYDASFSDG